MATKKRGKGRPRTSPDGGIREQRGILRASEEEWGWIQARMVALGIDRIGEYIRKMCLRGFGSKRKG